MTNLPKCPKCERILFKYFDGSQTYMVCQHADCGFDSLLGDGDLRESEGDSKP